MRIYPTLPVYNSLQRKGIVYTMVAILCVALAFPALAQDTKPKLTPTPKTTVKPKPVAVPPKTYNKPAVVAAPISKPSTSASAILQSIADNMVYISGSTFIMGCTTEQGSDCDTNEKPTHQVTVSSYYLSKYEVTQAQWRSVMGSNSSYNSGCDNCPVERVSWNDAQGFIQKLNQQTGQRYRLPTEAEWEYAARGGNKSQGHQYSGGSFFISNVAWYDGNSGGKTHPVGQKQANELGLYDMSGNVGEWCSDWYGDYNSSPTSYPQGPWSGKYRVVRGGSWGLDVSYCRVSHRFSYSPYIQLSNLGFRLAHD